MWEEELRGKEKLDIRLLNPTPKSSNTHLCNLGFGPTYEARYSIWYTFWKTLNRRSGICILGRNLKEKNWKNFLGFYRRSYFEYLGFIFLCFIFPQKKRFFSDSQFLCRFLFWSVQLRCRQEDLTNKTDLIFLHFFECGLWKQPLVWILCCFIVCGCV